MEVPVLDVSSIVEWQRAGRDLVSVWRSLFVIACLKFSDVSLEERQESDLA